MRPQIVNIINFQRGCEPRDPNIDLLKPLQEQLKLIVQNQLPATFLLQYDALIREDFCQLIRQARVEFPDFEVGCWLEMVQPLVEKAGLIWPGRTGYTWDWHAQAGTTMGYPPEDRKKIIDIYMQDFRLIWGEYPHAVGAWAMDIISLTYLQQQYGIDAVCICKDQWGTDGYTLWGGYFNQAYYPSRKNMFSPAQTTEQQVAVPIFRMLGSDPIYQYDPNLLKQGANDPQEWMDVITLEPVYPGYGGRTDWVDWFFRENYNGLCLSFGYAQVGQENSFGWDGMAAGLKYQTDKIVAGRASGQLTVETLGNSGRRFKKTYPLTPSSVVAAMTDWHDQDKQAVWYCSRFYRTGLLRHKNRFLIRDIYRFDENYPERYQRDIVDGDTYTFDNLPIIDSSRWKATTISPEPGMPTGLSIWQQTIDGKSWQELVVSHLEVAEVDEQTLTITLKTEKQLEIKITLLPDRLIFHAADETPWQLCLTLNQIGQTDFVKLTGQRAKYSFLYQHNNFDYFLTVTADNIKQNGDSFRISPIGHSLELIFTDSMDNPRQSR